MATLTWARPGDILSPCTWSPAQHPDPGDIMLQRQGYTWALFDHAADRILVLGSYDAPAPATLLTAYSDVNVSLSGIPADQTRYAAIDAFGNNSITVEGAANGPEEGRGSLHLYNGWGADTALQAHLANDDLTVDGPGHLRNEQITARDTTIKITSDMLGAGSLDLVHGVTAELGGRVGAGQTMTFLGQDANVYGLNDLLRIDHADQFHGAIDASRSSSLDFDFVDLLGVPVDGATYANGRLTLWDASQQHVENIRFTGPATGFEVYQHTGGTGAYIETGGRNPGYDQLLLHVGPTA